MTGRELRGRRRARWILLATLAVDALAVFLFLAAPNTTGPLYTTEPSFISWLIPAFGLVTHLAGLVWMVRIYRADPEAGPSAWRAIHDR